MDRKTRVIWLVIGLVLFLACYIQAISLLLR